MLKKKKKILYYILFIILLLGLSHCVQRIRHQFYAPPIIFPDIMHVQKEKFYFIIVNDKKYYISASVSIEERDDLYLLSFNSSLNFNSASNSFSGETIPTTTELVIVENNYGEKFGPFSIKMEESEYVDMNKRIIFSTYNKEQLINLCKNVFFHGSNGTDFTSQIDPSDICVKRCPDINDFYFCSYRKKPVYFWEFWKNEFEWD